MLWTSYFCEEPTLRNVEISEKLLRTQLSQGEGEKSRYEKCKRSGTIQKDRPEILISFALLESKLSLNVSTDSQVIVTTKVIA